MLGEFLIQPESSSANREPANVTPWKRTHLAGSENRGEGLRNYCHWIVSKSFRFFRRVVIFEGVVGVQNT